VGAALAASLDWGEQESADMWRHAAKEYKARANAMSSAGKWHVNGSADHPVLAESIKWRRETKSNEKVIWDRWLEIKREVGSVLLPLLKNHLAKQQPKGEEGANNLQISTVEPIGRRLLSKYEWITTRRRARVRAHDNRQRAGTLKHLQPSLSTDPQLLQMGEHVSPRSN
jgi:hypothetical protein